MSILDSSYIKNHKLRGVFLEGLALFCKIWEPYYNMMWNFDVAPSHHHYYFESPKVAPSLVVRQTLMDAKFCIINCGERGVLVVGLRGCHLQSYLKYNHVKLKMVPYAQTWKNNIFFTTQIG